MGKARFWILVMGFWLLLSACGASGGEEKQSAAALLQAEYQSLPGCSMTAKVRCEQAEETAEYTLRCDWKNDGTARVTIVEPEELEGISASFSGGSMTLLYEDVSLAAGTVSAEELSPAQVLPLVVQAIREGYILEKGTDKVDGVPCLRLVFDTTGEQGGKIYTHVWFAENHLPVYAEVEAEQRLLFTVDFTGFSAAPAEEIAAESETG